MNPSAEQQDKLEQLVNRALQEQPLRHAPPSLEFRVLAEIERRARQPWWRKNFAYWPIAARIAFFIASIAFVKGGVAVATWMIGRFESAALATHLPPEVTWIHTVMAALIFVVRNIPPLWIYGGATVLAAMYAVLFGISAAAYRTLYASR